MLVKEMHVWPQQPNLAQFSANQKGFEHPVPGHMTAFTKLVDNVSWSKTYTTSTESLEH